YHKNGQPQWDRTRVGLHFANEPIEKRARVMPVLNTGLAIPPGSEHYEVTASAHVPMDVTAGAVIPHMHLLGREIKVPATLPDGTVKPLVWIKDWDFNWQATYQYRKPLALPKGTKLDLVAVYDNSEKNPRQTAHPPRLVRFGEQTTDEMCFAFFGLTADAE